MPKPAQTKPRLGRGLSSLMTDSVKDRPDLGQYLSSDPPQPQAAQTQAPPVGTVAAEIPIARIAANPYQPRKDFDDDQLADLAASIAAQGILQPLIVAPAEAADSDQPYTLVAGERRLRAARQAGLEAVPCIIRDASRQEMLEWALVENIHRTDLNVLERANAYREYIDRFHLTQAEAAQRLGQPRATVANYLRMLDLSDEVQELLARGRLSFGHGKVLAGLVGDPARQRTLARRAARGGLSVRQLEEFVAAKAKARAAQSARAKPAYIRDLEDQLTRAIGTRVTIKPGRAKNCGRITIEYYSLDDFDRLAGALGLQVNS